MLVVVVIEVLFAKVDEPLTDVLAALVVELVAAVEVEFVPNEANIKCA